MTLMSFVRLPDPVVWGASVDAKEAGRIMKTYRARRGLTQEQAVERSTLPNSQYLSALENGRYDVRNSDHFRSLVEVYGLSIEEVRALKPDALISMAAPPIPSTGMERVFTRFSDSGQTGKSDTAQGGRLIELLHSDFVTIPVYGLAAAGDALYSEDSVIGVITLLKTDIHPGHHIIRVCGDSMAPGMQDGDHVSIDPHDTRLQDGRVFVFHLHGNGHALKRVRTLADGQMWLTSDNPEHPPIKPEEVTVRGRAVRHFPKGRDL